MRSTTLAGAVAALESYDIAPAAEAPTASTRPAAADLVITWHHTGTSSENGILTVALGLRPGTQSWRPVETR